MMVNSANEVSAATANTTPTEKDALMSLYTSTRGDLWYRSDNWTIGDPCLNSWYGITCDNASHVTSVSLSENNLNGTLSSSQLSGLIHCQLFDIGTNNISGDLTTLFSTWSQLNELHLQNNQFEGDISWTNSLQSNITFLWIAGNRFTGVIQKEWSKFKKLNLLFIELNQLSGTIPDEIGEMESLNLLDFGFNSIEGPVPESIQYLTKLTHLWAYDNNLSGNLPYAISNMSNLITLEFTRNKMSGEIPIDIFNKSNKIQSIRLSGNQFIGQLHWICNLTAIEELLLNDNKFTILPDCSQAIPDTLTDLVLDGNQLYGTLPNSLGNLRNLRYLNLRNNRLFGSIPSSLEKCINLSRIDISENEFNCTLTELMGPIRWIPYLSILTANNNNISGGFNEDMFWDQDNERELLTSLFILDLSHNKLNGPLSDYLSWMLSLSQMDLSNNNFEGVIPDVLNYLSELYFDNNNLSSPDGRLPAFMVPSKNYVKMDQDNFVCPTILGKDSEMMIKLDPKYFNYSLCSCITGTFGVNGTCKVCPENAQCPGNGTSIIIPSGYFPLPTVEQPDYLLQCPISNFGTTSCNPSSSSNFTCKPGFTDRLCSRCQDRFFLRGADCVKCPDGSQSIAVFIAVLIVLILILIFFILTDPKGSLPSATRKTIVFYYQALNLLLSKLSPWPSYFAAYYTSSSFINFSLGFLCIGELTKWPNLFMVIICLPPVVVALSCVFLVIVKLVYVLRAQPFDRKWIRSCLRVNLVVLNFLYLPLCIYILQNYSCTYDPFTHDSYMSFFPWIQCSYRAGVYSQIFKATVAATVVYVIGIPVLFCWLLFRYRNRLDDPFVLSFVGSLYIDYRKSVYYYEIILLVRRFMMAVSLALIDPKSSFSVFVVLLVIGGSIISQLTFSPFIFKVSNYTELAGSSVLLFSYVCVMILSSLRTTNQYDSIGIQVILGIVIITYTVYLGILFLFSLKYFLPRSIQERIDKHIVLLQQKFALWKVQYDKRQKQREEEDEMFYQSIDNAIRRQSSLESSMEMKRRSIKHSSEGGNSNNNSNNSLGNGNGGGGDNLKKSSEKESSSGVVGSTTTTNNNNANNNNINNNQDTASNEYRE
ncbi:hypothetical protein SAMD00019534_074880 [Acytostelium subglobosum LB1]|uniref:hypothetical protein n=1 Tax=Acytostelium subglobosum LB1 TaxID=1410327 RepID=UPI000644DB30|nr:hypothetical protein SAMD00019534_074880 [Acytostelium subglobosum LB1]GAM24313.1 hypothetical protein SAMD00019534_074880 [Acytostelium subglobosum LB1]|eukprot:XP_012752639.1 hypothetical protein SAMD00019534_074880 [Acytostelium subglobosum LB1]